MATITLTINDTEIPLTKGSYSEKRNSVDNKNTTEAGTTVRELIRSGIVSLSVSLNCDAETKALLDGFADEASVTVIYWSESSSALVTITAYLDGYSASLLYDLSDDRIYDVSFTIEELAS